MRGLGTNTNLVMGHDGAQNQEKLRCTRPAAIYSTEPKNNCIDEEQQKIIFVFKRTVVLERTKIWL
jgi:hypothetical protein